MHQREEQGSGEQGVEVRGREVLGKAMTSRGGGGGGDGNGCYSPKLPSFPRRGVGRLGKKD